MQPHRSSHRFIVLDGVEGCGKSTQAALLAQHLRQSGQEVVVTHEPGGTAAGEAIRTLLLDSDLDMSALTEAFLFCASRAQHLQDTILPALEAGKVVVCDRFSSATAAYQGYAGGVGLDRFEELDRITTGGCKPDMTVVLDMDPAVGRKRRELAAQGAPDRIERKPDEYHRRVQEGFLEYARRLGPQGAVVNADRSVEEVHQAILQVLDLS